MFYYLLTVSQHAYCNVAQEYKPEDFGPDSQLLHIDFVFVMQRAVMQAGITSSKKRNPPKYVCCVISVG